MGGGSQVHPKVAAVAEDEVEEEDMRVQANLGEETGEQDAIAMEIAVMVMVVVAVVGVL